MSRRDPSFPASPTSRSIATVSFAAIAAVVGAALAGCSTLPGAANPASAVDAPVPPQDSGAAAALERFEYRRMAMGGEARLVFFAPDEPVARAAAIAAFDEIEAVEQALSDWRDASEVREVERALAEDRGVAVAVSPVLATCLARALEVSRASDGAFDVTIAPVVEQWRIARRAGGLPPAETRRAALDLVGWDRVGLLSGDPPSLTAPPGTRFDFGGIGKGFGADRALAVLRRHGLERAMVELGGDFAIGAAPPDEPDQADTPDLRDEPAARGASGWTIAIATGLGDERLVLTLAECGVATSGDLERFVEIDGVRYSHLVDPRTGMGLTTSIAATVIAPDATLADALASATSVLGAERAASVLEEFDASARVVTASPGAAASKTPRIATIGAWPE